MEEPGGSGARRPSSLVAGQEEGGRNSWFSTWFSTWYSAATWLAFEPLRPKGGLRDSYQLSITELPHATLGDRVKRHHRDRPQHACGRVKTAPQG